MLINLIGKTFGSLEVVSRAENTKSGHPRWNCHCTCGSDHVVEGKHLRSGAVKSCGHGKRNKKTEPFKTTHGLGSSRIYRTWSDMIRRCYDPKHTSYKYYGDRGITVCKRWKSFENFVLDVKDIYKEDLTLDRENNNLGYSPQNCRFVSFRTQANNKRNSLGYFYVHGEMITLSEASEIYDVTYSTLYRRVKVKGQTLEDAIEG